MRSINHPIPLLTGSLAAPPGAAQPDPANLKDVPPSTSWGVTLPPPGTTPYSQSFHGGLGVCHFVPIKGHARCLRSRHRGCSWPLRPPRPGQATSAEDLVLVIHLSDVLTRGLRLGDPGDALVPVVDQEAWSRAALDTKTTLREFYRDLLRRFEATSDVLEEIK